MGVMGPVKGCIDFCAPGDGVTILDDVSFPVTATMPAYSLESVVNTNPFEAVSDTEDENDDVYSASVINMHRFTEINDNILSKLTELYIEKMVYFLNMSKSVLMMDICMMISSGGNRTVGFDFHKVHNMCIHELLRNNYSKYAFLEVIEENDTHSSRREEITHTIFKCSTTINKLKSLKDGTYVAIMPDSPSPYNSACYRERGVSPVQLVGESDQVSINIEDLSSVD